MKINWKVRLRNPVFWITMIPAVCCLLYTFFGLVGIAPAVSEDTVQQTLITIVTALSALGVLVDPTTEGIEDSDRAMTYETPSE